MAGATPIKGAAWAKNAAILVAMSLFAVCGYQVCAPEEATPPVSVVAVPPPTPPVFSAPPPEPVIEPVAVVPPVVAAVAPAAAPPPPLVAPAVVAAAAPVVVAAAATPPAAPVPAAAAPTAAAAAPSSTLSTLPPVGAPPPPAPANFLPIGNATEQFSGPLESVAGGPIAFFDARPGLAQINQSLAVIQPCEAASSCSFNVPAPAGPVGFTVVGGSWPPPTP